MREGRSGGRRRGSGGPFPLPCGRPGRLAEELARRMKGSSRFNASEEPARDGGGAAASLFTREQPGIDRRSVAFPFCLEDSLCSTDPRPLPSREDEKEAFLMGVASRQKGRWLRKAKGSDRTVPRLPRRHGSWQARRPAFVHGFLPAGGQEKRAGAASFAMGQTFAFAGKGA